MTPTPRLSVLDGLRLVAALMVALYHFTGFEEGVRPAWGVDPSTAFPDIYGLTSYGYLGVDLFFMISGFVICMSSWGRTAGGFLRSRVVRLFPAYWPAVLITATVVHLWPTTRDPQRFNDVLVNLTMLQAPVGVPAVDGVYWSLWVEAKFYLLFAVCLLWRGTLTLRRATIFGYAWLLAAVLSHNAESLLLKIIFQPAHAPMFVAGIAFYLIHRFGSNIQLWGLVGVSFALGGHNAIDRLEYVGPRNLGRDLSPTVGFLMITAFFVILAAIALGWTARVRWRWLTTAGLLTYPFYLLHEHIGWVIIHALRDVRPRWAVLGLVLAVMLLAAWLLHRLVEKPLAGWLRARLEAASRANAAAEGPANRVGDQRTAPAHYSHAEPGHQPAPLEAHRSARP